MARTAPGAADAQAASEGGRARRHFQPFFFRRFCSGKNFRDRPPGNLQRRGDTRGRRDGPRPRKRQDGAFQERAPGHRFRRSERWPAHGTSVNRPGRSCSIFPEKRNFPGKETGRLLHPPFGPSCFIPTCALQERRTLGGKRGAVGERAVFPLPHLPPQLFTHLPDSAPKTLPPTPASRARPADPAPEPRGPAARQPDRGRHRGGE